MSQDVMSRAIVIWFLAACLLALAGCSSPFGQQGYFQDKSGDYTKARITEPLTIPEEMNAEPMSEALVIPDTAKQHDPIDPDFVVPRPDQTLSSSDSETFTLKRDGTHRYLMTSLSQEETWKNLLAFLAKNQLPVSTQDDAQAYLETDWAELGKDKQYNVIMRSLGKLLGTDVSEPMQDRFQIEVKPSQQSPGAEVYIRHKGRSLKQGKEKVTAKGSIKAGGSDWNAMPERSQKIGEAVLNDLMLYLTERGRQASDSYLTQTRDQDLSELAVMEIDGAGNPQLRLEQLSYARSWSAVDKALINAGVHVSDKNRTAGIFYIQVGSEGAVTKEEWKKSWFSGWFGGDDKEEQPSESESILLMRVIEFNRIVRVSVEKDINTTASADVSSQLLNLVKDNL